MTITEEFSSHHYELLEYNFHNFEVDDDVSSHYYFIISSTIDPIKNFVIFPVVSILIES
jgi:hypothetical protein